MTLSLDQLKDLYKKGMEYARTKDFLLYSSNTSLCDYQLSLALQAKDLTTFMNAVWIPNPQWSNLFNAPKAVKCGTEIQYTGIQFGVGSLEWYFFYGIAGDYCYNLSFFKQEIAPPHIVKSLGIDPSEAVRWNVVGGCGKISDQSWYNINSEYIYMKYTQPSYSTFTLEGSGEGITVLLSSVSPMKFNIALTFKDRDTKANHTLNVIMLANSPPSPNFPNACECGLGLGTMYYSYTDVSSIISLDSPNTFTGTSWIDHQLVKPGIVNNWYWRALSTVQNVISKNKTAGWLWTSIQDWESGIQYMLVHYFGKKYYIEDVFENTIIPFQLINVYKKGETYSKDEIDTEDFSCVMTETIGGLPKKYKIVLPGGKNVMLSIATSPNIYNTPGMSYECPAILTDSSGKQIGIGLIEANLYITNEVFAKRLINSAGGDSNNKDNVGIVLTGIEGNQTVFQKFLAFIIVLIPLWIILGALLYVLYGKDSIGSDRKHRLIISIIILLVVYLVWKINIPSI